MNTFLQIGIALGLGLLVGLQRERTQSDVAGIRTFPLITLFGLLCSTLSAGGGVWLPAAGLLRAGRVRRRHARGPRAALAVAVRTRVRKCPPVLAAAVGRWTMGRSRAERDAGAFRPGAAPGPGRFDARRERFGRPGAPAARIDARARIPAR